MNVDLACCCRNFLEIYEYSKKNPSPDPLRLMAWIEEQQPVIENMRKPHVSSPLIAKFRQVIELLYQNQLVDGICKEPLQEPLIERGWVWEQRRYEDYVSLWKTYYPDSPITSPFGQTASLDLQAECSSYPLAEKLISWINALPLRLRSRAAPARKNCFQSPLFRHALNRLHSTDNPKMRFKAYQLLGRLHSQDALAKSDHVPLAQERSQESIDLQVAYDRTQNLLDRVKPMVKELQEATKQQLQEMSRVMEDQVEEFERYASTAIDHLENQNVSLEERLQTCYTFAGDLQEQLKQNDRLFQEELAALNNEKKIFQREKQENVKLQQQLSDLRVEYERQEAELESVNSEVKKIKKEREDLLERYELNSNELKGLTERKENLLKKNEDAFEEGKKIQNKLADLQIELASQDKEQQIQEEQFSRIVEICNHMESIYGDIENKLKLCENGARYIKNILREMDADVKKQEKAKECLLKTANEIREKIKDLNKKLKELENNNVKIWLEI